MSARRPQRDPGDEAPCHSVQPGERRKGDRNRLAAVSGFKWRAGALLLLHLYGDVRQGTEAPQQRLVIIRSALSPRCDRDDGAEMTGSEAPHVQIGQTIAV